MFSLVGGLQVGNAISRPVRRIRNGAFGGVLLGALFALMRAIAALVDGGNGPTDPDTTLLHWVVFLVAGGAAAGGVGGLLFPLMRTRIGAAMGGFVALMPMARIGSWMLAPNHSGDWIGYGLWCLVIGAPSAIGLRAIWIRQHPTDEIGLFK